MDSILQNQGPLPKNYLLVFRHFLLLGDNNISSGNKYGVRVRKSGASVVAVDR